MTNEEAIKDFQSDVEFCKEFFKEGAFAEEEYAKDIEADLIAIEAIEYRIKVPPVQDPKTTKWFCMRCGNWIAERQHYCDKCGQAIDWEVLNVSRS